jgi:hypothetical protein
MIICEPHDPPCGGRSGDTDVCIMPANAGIHVFLRGCKIQA